MKSIQDRRTRNWLCVLVVVLVGCGRDRSWGSRSVDVDASLDAAPGPGSLSADRREESGYVPGVPNQEMKLSEQEKLALLRLARTSMETYVRSGVLPEAPEDLRRNHPALSAPGACFVTLRMHGDLRGCIGTLEARRSLIEDVRHNAVAAAVSDTRFSPVTSDELSQIDCEISVLDKPRPLEGMAVDELPAYLAKHKPGLIIEYRGRRSTFLPSVWEDLPDPNDFLERLCRKQGSPPTCWRDPTARMSVYGSIHFGEKDTH